MRCHVFFKILSGAFLLFSQKKLAKLQQAEQGAGLPDVYGRNVAVQQVFDTFQFLQSIRPTYDRVRPERHLNSAPPPTALAAVALSGRVQQIQIQQEVLPLPRALFEHVKAGRVLRISV